MFGSGAHGHGWLTTPKPTPDWMGVDCCGFQSVYPLISSPRVIDTTVTKVTTTTTTTTTTTINTALTALETLHKLPVVKVKLPPGERRRRGALFLLPPSSQLFFFSLQTSKSPLPASAGARCCSSCRRRRRTVDGIGRSRGFQCQGSARDGWGSGRRACAPPGADWSLRGVGGVEF